MRCVFIFSWECCKCKVALQRFRGSEMGAGERKGFVKKILHRTARNTKKSKLSRKLCLLPGSSCGATHVSTNARDAFSATSFLWKIDGNACLPYSRKLKFLFDNNSDVTVRRGSDVNILFINQIDPSKTLCIQSVYFKNKINSSIEYHSNMLRLKKKRIITFIYNTSVCFASCIFRRSNLV